MAYHPQVRHCSRLHPPDALRSPPRPEQPGFQYQPSTHPQPSQAHQQNSMQAILNHQDSYSVIQQQQLVGDEEYKSVLLSPSSSSLPPGVRQLTTLSNSCSRLLKNYKLAHLRIEEQRSAMLEQEKQVRSRAGTLASATHSR